MSPRRRTSCRETLKYLFGLEKLGIRPGLERISRLLSFLDNPHLKYPSVVIGGTNGKGSTAAMTESILREAGFTTGLYTSPHLNRFNERIRVSGREITDGEVVGLTSIIRSIIEDYRGGFPEMPSFFEFTTAMAFEHFRRKKVDLAVCEVGMGGRWDAVNVLTPEVSVITGVSLDHIQYLGTSIGKIAFEKAGIIKGAVPCVIGVRDASALKVIKKEAAEKKTNLYVIGRDFRVEPSMKGFDYHGAGELGRLKGLRVNLRGAHQLGNAACALKAIEVLRSRHYPITAGAIRKGLERVSWPGRFEVLRKKPTVVVDCAHNPEGAWALARALKELGCARIILVLGVMADKDIDGIFSALLPLAHAVVLTRPLYTRSAGVELLREKLVGRKGGYAGEVVARERVSCACDEAMALAGENGAVCVTGSIFTVAEARDYLLKNLRAAAGR
ncbi:MAG: bifunctional folylpolyglutamate synthase/dihydrofolate synthase [Deltaproteobacteria bacterium]|nr:bifunctional folylpolyglutamate synthase/dihydrofolate synthase [Deltaproteobacteria bacterium]